MKKVAIIIICLLSMEAVADDIDEVVSALGVSKVDLKMIWHGGRCEPNWSFKVDRKDFENKSLLGYKAVKSNFFESIESNDEVVLSPGEKCVAVNDYYFEQKESKKIEGFIEKDVGFIKEYGFSVLDAVYVEGTQFYSWNGEVSAFHLRFAKSVKEKGLFTLVEKSSTFNGKPSKAFSGERTPVGDAFHDRVFQ